VVPLPVLPYGARVDGIEILPGTFRLTGSLPALTTDP
jgi:hypothetical protein